jgi:hypothetical protein
MQLSILIATLFALVEHSPLELKEIANKEL